MVDKLLEAVATLSTVPSAVLTPKNSPHWAYANTAKCTSSPRLIYRVMGKQVFTYIIADGRRDMQALLSRRMLGV